MIHNKKQTSFILLTIVILSVSFLMGRNQHSSATAKGLSSKNAGPEHPSVVGNVSINKKNGVRTFTRNNMALQASAQQDSACGKSTMYSTQKGRLTAYMSGQAKGVIGLFDGNKTDNPVDNIFSVNLDYQPTVNDKVWLTYHLTGVSDNCGVACSINDRLAFGGYLIKKDTSTTVQRIQLSAAWLQKGENRIQFGLPENADYGYRISDLALEVEKDANVEPLSVDASQNLYGGKVYVHGFLQKTNAISHISIDGQKIALHDGEFEALVTPNGQQTEVKADITGRIFTHILHFVNNINADKEYALRQNSVSTLRLFEKGKINELKTTDVLLKTDNKTQISTKQFSLTSLRSVDIPALDLGMTNVTADSHGFRFLPHGEHFSNKGATVALKYDRSKIPDGYTENDIRTFYFDQNTRHWVALERDTVDKSLCMVMSKTTHFTDMINGVIKTPESPQTEGFASTMMNNIKAADPTSKIELIAPPSANSQGSANLSYNLEMPPARNGMTPQLTVAYNSDGGSGWLGEGWDLNVPTISVDTRWGVPRYNDSIETETYSLSGTMLVTTDDQRNSSVAHRGNKIPRTTDRQFYPRIETGYSKIVRKGNSPENYYWEVTDKNGTKYTYGGNDATLKGFITPINNQTKKVSAEWKLKRVEEIHGDYINYYYDTIQEKIRDGMYAKAIYLSRIEMGNGGTQPHTIISFVSNSVNIKQRNNARYGFLVSGNKLLDSVRVVFEGQCLRNYSFTYTIGDFYSRLLNSVTQFDNKGVVLAKHSFSYYSNTLQEYENGKLFDDEKVWNLGDDQLSTSLFGKSISGISNNATALGGSTTDNWGASLYLGVGVYWKDKALKGFSGGASISYSQSSTRGMSTLIDINGDGLPDKVFRNSNEDLYFRPNLGFSGVDASGSRFGEPIKISGINSFLSSKSNSLSFGGQFYLGVKRVGVNGGVNKNTTYTKTPIYFSDVNNDGLMDVVDNGTVYFNHITYNPTGIAVPSFSKSSSDTPGPIMGGGTIIKDESSTSIAEETAEQDSLLQMSPMQDVVRVWQAPYAGTIKIEGNVQYVIPSGDYDKDAYALADGVRVAIQVGGNEKWAQFIAKGDATSYSPENVSNISIEKGQRVYFRVQSGNQMKSDGSFDKVTWSPVITYTDKGDNIIDANGYGSNVYKASEGDLKSSDAMNAIFGATSVNVGGRFVKPVTTSEVTLKIILSNDSCLDDGSVNTNYQEQTVYTRNFGIEAFDGNLDIPIANSIGGQSLQFQISASTDVAWEKIKWTPLLNFNIEGQNVSYIANVEYNIVNKVVSDPVLICDGAVINSDEIDGIFEDYNGSNSSCQFISWNIMSILISPNYPTKFSSGNHTFTMKVFVDDVFAAENSYQIIDGVPCWPSDGFVHIDYSPNKNITVKYYFDDNLLDRSALTALSCSIQVEVSGVAWVNGVQTVNYATIIPIKSATPVSVFCIPPYNPFGPMWRGWGQYVYNASGDRYSKPIDESLLQLPQDSVSANPLTMGLMPLTLDNNTKNYWVGQNENIYIKADTMSAARLGIQSVSIPDPYEGLGGTITTSSAACSITGSNADGPVLYSRSKSSDKMAGASYGSAGLNGNTSNGTSQTKMAFMDMNGDGYPDLVEENQIQYTNTRGGRDGEVLQGIHGQNSKSHSYSLGGGGDAMHAYTMISGILSGQDVEARAKASSDQAKEPVSLSGSAQYNIDESVETYIDINGDGLPDKVNSDNTVQFNLGYGFSSRVNWDLGPVDKGTSTPLNISTGLGFQMGKGSFNVGFGAATCTSKTEYYMIDINGDGLPDRISKSGDNIMVQYNLGNTFTDVMTLDAASLLHDINKSSSSSVNLNGAGTVNIPLFLLAKLTVNPDGFKSKSLNRTTQELRDVDGDGYPDIVSSDADGTMFVRRSRIGCVNKLSSVSNPFGGIFSISYERSKATPDHPGGKWVMDSVVLNNYSVVDDKPLVRTAYEYDNGRYERYEREFLGFGKVVTKNIDTEHNNTVYRTVTQEFDVRNSYVKGNLLRTAVADGNGNPYTENINRYYSYVVSPQGNSYDFMLFDSICSDHDIAYMPLKYSKTILYEGQPTGLTANESLYQYHVNKGDFGELKNYTYSNKGKLGLDGSGDYNYRTEIEYKPAITSGQYILGLPASVKVTGNDAKTLREVSASYEDPLNPDQITKTVHTLSGGQTAVTDIEYDSYGNIRKKTLPANYRDERMWYSYSYDDTYHMYPTLITDAFGYSSKLENYDYRYGIPCKTTDENGNIMTTAIDDVGRVTRITGPNESDYTIQFEYHPSVDITNDLGYKRLPYAITRHYDPTHPGNPIETVTFVDGFGKAIQVKKDGEVNGEEKMIVSGRARYDAFGRVRSSCYPVVESNADRKYWFNASFDSIVSGIPATRTAYDILDRVTRVTLPDNTATITGYSISGGLQKITVTDALGNKQESFADGSGKTVRTNQYQSSDTVLTTLFHYDAIEQLDTVTDAMGKQTISTYDMGGRRTRVQHPASGISNFEYDPSGNLLSKQTANLIASGKKINYFYTYNRLDSIAYPDHPENNVIYRYGTSTEAGSGNFNRAGRLKYQEDGSGTQEFKYGLQGELTEVKRTLVIPNQAVATYTTKWAYDSWNRLLNMTYPDGEQVNYTYNTGGQLTGVNSSTNNYVSSILYDKFEQRTYLKYGNGSETNYTYNPLNRRLDNLKVTVGSVALMNNAYSYDAVSNVTKIVNTGAATNGIGGAITHNYAYDKLYRLKSANGAFTGAGSKTASYTLAMGYDKLHNITSKQQHITQNDVQFTGTLQAGYDLSYAYNAANCQQISNIAESSYRTEGTGTNNPDSKVSQFSYDANGNLLSIQTGTKSGINLLATNSRRLLWDEENRLLGVSDNGYVSNYWYDAAGERTVKESFDNEGVRVNSVQSASRTGTTKFTAYISPYMVVNNGGNYTKHIYIGSQRITSKLSNSGIFTTSPVNTNDLQSKYTLLTAGIKQRFDSLGVTYSGSPQTGGLVSGTPSTTATSYFYHSDHLGSSSLITDGTGAPIQHLEYVPFGETFIDERKGSWHTPYLFNAKERDEETGLYYYGHRYYDSRTGTWISSDDLREKYPNISSYVYCADNPIKLIDPDGNDITIGGQNGSSVVFKTDLIDVSVNASSLGVDFGGNYTLEGEHILGAVLDIVGVFDPTGVADGLNASLSAKKGEWLDAGISALGLIPYAGDLAKAGKIKKDIKIVEEAINVVKEANRVKYLRQKAVKEAWAAEKKLVEKTGQGSRRWTEKELKELKETGKVKGYEGHHINSVNGHPDNVGDPANIKFVRKGREHLNEHNGNYRNQSSGQKINRTPNE